MDSTFIQKKMNTLSEYIAKLERLVTPVEIKEIRNEEMRLDAVERNFQLAVDQMVDINTHLIKTGGFGTVDDLQSTFKMLGDFKVLEKNFAEKLAPIVGVRNMLVHRYEKLDKDLFLTNLKKNFSDFKTYMIQIDTYINKA